VWVASIALVLSGGGNGAAVVCNALMVQRGVPDRLRGRAFTLLMSSNFAVLGVGMLVAGPATDAFGPRWVWGAAAVLMASAAVLGFVLARGIREREGAGEREPVVGELGVEPARSPTGSALG
jgi:MFS family permease